MVDKIGKVFMATVLVVLGTGFIVAAINDDYDPVRALAGCAFLALSKYLCGLSWNTD